MKGALIRVGEQCLHINCTDKEEGHITLSISEKKIEVRDDLHHTVSSLAPSAGETLHIETGEGAGIVHLETNGPLSDPLTVQIDACSGDAMIVGTPDPKVELKVNARKSHCLVLPDDDEETYREYALRIKEWNEKHRKKDGWGKGLKRRLVYFFGRDLRFKRPLAIEKKLRQWVPLVNNESEDLGIPFYYTTRANLDELESLARPGDILLRYQDGYPLDRFFVGTWQHAGLYWKKGYVIDAMGPGTYLRTLDQFGESDGIALLRLSGTTETETHRALSYAFEQIGKYYSVDFDEHTSEQYCSGLVVNAYIFAGRLPVGYGHHATIRPDDLLQLPGVEVIWTNRDDLLQRSRKAKTA